MTSICTCQREKALNTISVPIKIKLMLELFQKTLLYS